MQYKQYLPGTPTYVVHHTQGFGVMESPYKELEVVFASEDYDECMAFGQKTYPRDPSGWTYDSFTINVNILTPAGKALYADFDKKFQEMRDAMSKNPNAREYIMANGITVVLEHNPLFDEPQTPKV